MPSTAFVPFELDADAFLASTGTTDRRFLELIGELRGKTVLDIGCGNGVFSVYFAKRGACVTAIDQSPVAIANTLNMAKINGVTPQLKALQMDALALDALAQSFDLVVGRFILHHIEPFAAFVEILGRALGNNRGIFMENSARNPVLMFFRRHLVGKFGIPRFSDNVEYPLEPKEIALLIRRFTRVHLHFPDFVFCSLIGAYLPGYRWPHRLFQRMDAHLHRWLPFLRKYSYCQIIEIQPSPI